MSKLTGQEKIQAVKRYFEGVESQHTLAKSLGVSQSILLTWIRQYQHHGEASFKKGYTAYSAEYKLMVLSYVSEHGTSLREAAAIFNIPTHSILSRWKKELEEKGVDALKPKPKGRILMKKENEKNAKTAKKQPPLEGSVEALQAEVDGTPT